MEARLGTEGNQSSESWVNKSTKMSRSRMLWHQELLFDVSSTELTLGNGSFTVLRAGNLYKEVCVSPSEQNIGNFIEGVNAEDAF